MESKGLSETLILYVNHIKIQVYDIIFHGHVCGYTLDILYTCIHVYCIHTCMLIRWGTLGLDLEPVTKNEMEYCLFFYSNIFRSSLSLLLVRGQYVNMIYSVHSIQRVLIILHHSVGYFTAYCKLTLSFILLCPIQLTTGAGLQFGLCCIKFPYSFT